MKDQPDHRDDQDRTPKETGAEERNDAQNPRSEEEKAADESRLTGLGSRIRVYDINGKKYMFVTLVEERTITPDTKGIKIAVESPLGAKLLGQKVGSIVEHNDVKFRIVNYTRGGKFFS